VSATIYNFPSHRVSSLLDPGDFSARPFAPIRSRYSLRVRVSVIIGAGLLFIGLAVLVIWLAESVVRMLMGAG
jgi:hypothetical protein